MQERLCGVLIPSACEVDLIIPLGFTAVSRGLA